MKKYFIAYVVLFAAVAMTFPALAGSRDECIAKCKEASEFVKNHGIEATVKEISNKNGLFVWNKGISYVFLMNMKGKMLAHPHDPNLAKRDSLIDLVDTDGKPFVKGMIRTAKRGKGWSKYNWPVPGMDVVKPKHTFIFRVPGTDYFVGAGIYIMGPSVYY